MTITITDPNSIAFVFRRRRAVTPPALRLRASSGPISLASASRTLVVVAAQRERMPEADRANPSNIASRRLPCAQTGDQFDGAVDLSP